MTLLVGMQLTGVGPFIDKKIVFHSGLNIVFGPNEAGKTVLLRAMLATLAGDPSSRNLRRAVTEASGAAVRLERDGQAWIVDRDFISNRVVVSRVEDNKAVEHWCGTATLEDRGPAGRAFRELLASLFDLPDPTVLSALWRDWRQPLAPEQTTAAVRRLFVGNSIHDHQRALHALKEQYFSLTKVNPEGRNRTRPGRLEHLAEEISAARQRVEAAEASFARATHAEAVYLACRQRSSTIRQELELLNDRLDRLADYLDLEERRGKIAEKLALLDHEKQQVEMLRHRKEELQTRLEEYAAVEDLEENRLAAIKHKRRLLATAAEREAKRQALARDLAGPRNWREPLGALGLAASGFGGILLLRWRPPWRTGLAVALILFAVATLGWLVRRRLLRRARRRALAESLAGSATDRDHALAAAQAVELGEGLDHLNLAELGQTLERFAAAKQLRQELEIVLQESGHLPDLEMLVQVERHLHEQATEIEDRLEALADFNDEARDKAELLGELTSRLETLEKADDLAQQEKKRAAQDRLARHAALENPAGWRRRLAVLEAEYEDQEQNSRALRLAIAALEEAQQAYLGEDLSRLTRHCQALLDELIPGNRRKLLLDRHWQPLLVGAEGPVEMDHLSSALGEQVLCCCRLALADQLTGGRPVPYWFDNPARGWDAARRRTWMGLLRRLAEQRQVILLTADESLVEAAGEAAHVVRLP